MSHDLRFEFRDESALRGRRTAGRCFVRLGDIQKLRSRAILARLSLQMSEEL